MRSFPLAFSLSLLFLVIFLSVAPASATHTVPKFEIKGRDLLAEKAIVVQPAKLGTVVVFLSARCPCSNAHVGLLKKMAGDFKNFSFVAVNSNGDEPPAEAGTYFRQAALPFPVLRDEDGKLADEYKALKTPHAFVLDAEGKTVYRGGVTSSVHGESADQQYLRDALTELEAGLPVKVAEGRTLGCMITRGPKK